MSEVYRTLGIEAARYDVIYCLTCMYLTPVGHVGHCNHLCELKHRNIAHD